MTRRIVHQHHRHQRNQPHPQPEQPPQGRGRCHRIGRQHPRTGIAAGACGNSRP
uniref:Uncharacterized protein n=1 Tax=Siphoviridae sp. ctZgu8 TaxID=2827893 RepID=A0A8S5SLK6_9CAUD|nr:MAG TPA: hypothetical protein [Siphoviridae sp. ctZgu8]